jgi:WS/DGAT/MGAT family acyltransferase
MSDITYADTMSNAEALMWRLETDPHLSSTFGNVSILDQPPDFDRFRARLERASRTIPRLRHVVKPSPGNLGPPRWVPDLEFDLDQHVRRIALPGPADDAALFALASAIVTDPFDRTRPLWQFTLVEGLTGGRAALIHKLHHTIADGESGVQLALEYLDLERNPVSTVDDVDPAADDAHDRSQAGPSGFVEDRATVMVRDALSGALRFPLGVARQVRELLADPSQIPAATASASDTMLDLVRQLGDSDRARSPLWTERSLRRHVGAASMPFADAKQAATVLGGTLNTAFVTIAAEASSRYHAEYGEPIDALRASMAISTRTKSSGANAFSIVRLAVPTSPMPIRDRFDAIRAATDGALDASRSTSLDAVAAVASTLPTPVVSRLARQQAGTIDFATSNVRGSPFPVFVGGGLILSNTPIGPLAGVAFNVTLLSYDGRLDMGVNVDRAAVAHPERIVELIQDVADEFIGLA